MEKAPLIDYLRHDLLLPRELVEAQRDADHAHYAPQIDRLEAEAKLDESRYAHEHGDYLVQKQRAEKAEARVKELKRRVLDIKSEADVDRLQGELRAKAERKGGK